MFKHTYLPASSSHRWIRCPPSARLNMGLEEFASFRTLQGTDAHLLCAYLISEALGRDVPDPTASLEYYDSEMQNCAEEYRNFILQQLDAARAHCPDPQILIEQRLNFSQWVPRGMGTSDCVIVADEELQIVDYKHGLGIQVEAENNSQLMCYALGALELFDGIYEIDNITMTIYQPRRDSVSTWSQSKAELLTWADTVLKPAALLAYKGKGEFASGEHCQFCRVKEDCVKYAEYQLTLAQRDFIEPENNII